MPSELNAKITAQLENFKVPSVVERERFLKRCVLSASGLRFIHSGDEEDASHWMCDEAQLFILAAVEAFAKLVKANKGQRLWLGSDARPTGPLLMALSAHYFKGQGFQLHTMGCSAIPQIMAATHQSGSDGFCYFTASHNPKGHNGLKLGLADGAVLGRELANELIQNLKTSYLSTVAMENLVAGLKLTKFIPTDSAQLQKDKAESLKYYEHFALETVASGMGRQFLSAIGSSWGSERPLLLLDMNGSSRLNSVDQEFIKAMGLRLEVMGATLGQFNHPIIP